MGDERKKWLQKNKYSEKKTVTWCLATNSHTLMSWCSLLKISRIAARSVEEKVRAIVGMEVRGVSPDALSGVASALRLLVRSTETALRTMNMAGESWPVDSLAVWAPEEDGPQFELQVEVMSVGDQQMEAA